MTTTDPHYPDNHQRSHGVLGDARLGRDLNTPEERRKAALFVAVSGSTVDERREVLMMLGLIQPDFKWIPNSGGARKKVDL